ncbi:MAG: DUF2062 domain-containing protein [Aureliella sp.]
MKFIGKSIRKYMQVAKDFCVYKILHADDPPHTLALGIAIGMFVTFTPLIGFQMVLSFALAWLLKANKAVGVPIVWISNPLTIIPIYYPCYVIGCKLLGTPVVSDEWTLIGDEWKALAADPATRWRDKVSFWWDNLMDFVGPLWLGCMVVATVTGVLSYYISLFAIRQYRLRRWGQLMPPSTTPIESIEDASIVKRDQPVDKDAHGESAA